MSEARWTYSDRQVIIAVSIALLICLAFLAGFAVGDMEWVARIRSSLLQMLQR
ncbi:MAG: hypothetical protein KBH81_15140 [Phycisphaerae bacterium]|jgi:hypothetical protein|nr:hypothetical protein [Phycisphaerae bacterium]HOO17563.1 hypothetical protein [Phycisphaerae bacterium]HPC21097.1 hypothetical protein [Phycisphaerae bacterium]HRS26639.1 hypothetical protein [Phycisphaerae bacterium]HRT42616.1 hypothetical protein [Phycisphaerae bacterium]